MADRARTSAVYATVRPPVNSRLLVVKFLGGQKLDVDFRPNRGPVPLIPMPCKGLTVF